MPHQTALLVTLAAAFGLAFVFGLAAVRLRMPPLVGYLLAGVVLGPSTPGAVADVALAGQLAEVGVILLMFGVGLHFSPGELLATRRVALPGAVAQVTVAALLGTALARWWGWPHAAAAVYGLTLSVASTVVVLRALEERALLDTALGRTAAGWLVVEDVVMVLVLVLLPALAVPTPGEGDDAARALAATVALTLGKVAAFLGVMLLAGRRAVPWLLTHVARTGSRELFTLAVLVVALGIAVGAAVLFGVSLALGAFVAGVVISESELSYQAGADALPLQDAFAILFFVSVGMLFDPGVLVREPGRAAATVAVVLLGNAGAALLLLLFLRYPPRPALQIAASLGQVGEFSFMLAGLGVALGVLPREGRDLVLAAALLTIVGNPLLFALAGLADRWLLARPGLLDRLERRSRPALAPSPGPGAERVAGHAIVVGFGRVGGTIGRALERRGLPYLVVEQDHRLAESARRQGVPVVFGDAARTGVLAHAHPERARLLVVATPNAYQARRVIELARHANPDVDTVVRTHGAEDQAYFERLAVGRAVMGERELALGMAHYALRSLGCEEAAADATIDALRRGDQDAAAPPAAPEPAVEPVA